MFILAKGERQTQHLRLFDCHHGCSNKHSVKFKKQLILLIVLLLQ